MTRSKQTDTQSENADESTDEALDPRIEAGWQALAEGELDRARSQAERAVKDDTVRADAMLLLAAVAREEGDFETALGKLQELAREEPDWCTPELWIAELLASDDARLSEAVAHARKALDLAEEEDDYLDALACKASVEIALGRFAEARKTLRGLPADDVPLDDAEVALDFAQLLIEAGDPAAAHARLQTLTAHSPDIPDGWYLLGVAAESLDDEQGKRAAWVKTRALDRAALDARAPSAGGAEDDRPRLTEETLVAVAEETLAEMPGDLRELLGNVPIVVADLPAADDVAAGLDPRLLGLFAGTPHADNAGVLAPANLSEILLFRANIERAAVDDEGWREEVRTTLLHEAGHFFGLDEAALARLGLS